MSLEHGSLVTETSTSGASPFVSGAERVLTESEFKLLKVLLNRVPQRAALRSQLHGTRVQAMQDGGMGSLRFVGSHRDREATEIIQAKSMGSDGIPLELSMNVDQYGELFELDIWKVDYSALIRTLEPGQVNVA